MALLASYELCEEPRSEDPERFALDALSVALADYGGVSPCTPEQHGIIIDRCAAMVYWLRQWWPTTGLRVLASEVEIRSHHQFERGGRIDFLVVDRNGHIGILDGKTFGVFGKSISAQSVIPDLNRDSQCGWYGAILQAGCTAFSGVGNADRATPTTELKKKYRSVELTITPSFYGQIIYGHLLRFERGDQKGQPRGKALFLAPFHDHLIRAADKLANWFWWSSSIEAPAIRRYDGQGQFSCDTCQNTLNCWPTADSPQPISEIPDFVRRLL
jgi:hypothetical protein